MVRRVSYKESINMTEQRLENDIVDIQTRNHESLIRDRLESLKDCSFEWRSSRSTEIVGSGAIKIDLHEQSTECLALLSKGDPKSWIEAYLYGHWTTHQLLPLIHQFVRQGHLENHSLTRWFRPILRLYQELRPGHRNAMMHFLGAHYSLSEHFFDAVLDKKHQLYGTALYPHPGATLEQAAQWQLQRLCEKLNILPTDRVLDIGSGFGSLGLYAAEHYGASVTIVAFHDQQREKIERMMHIKGLSSCIKIQSYDEVFGPDQLYDKIAFLFPFDWAGHIHSQDLLLEASQHLSPTGLMLTQMITQNDAHFGGFLERFMQDHVFSSYTLASLNQFSKHSISPSHCRLLHTETMDDHAARTLREWFFSLEKNKDFLKNRGVDLYFMRLYELKLALFYAGICTRRLQNVQLLWAGNEYHGNDWLLSHAKSAYFPSPYLQDFEA